MAKQIEVTSFIERYIELKRENPDTRDCDLYEMVEAERIAAGQPRKYKSHIVFRVVICRRRKNHYGGEKPQPVVKAFRFSELAPLNQKAAVREIYEWMQTLYARGETRSVISHRRITYLLLNFCGDPLFTFRRGAWRVVKEQADAVRGVMVEDVQTLF